MLNAPALPIYQETEIITSRLARDWLVIIEGWRQVKSVIETKLTSVTA
jgi:hypothetical protein